MSVVAPPRPPRLDDSAQALIEEARRRQRRRRCWIAALLLIAACAGAGVLLLLTGHSGTGRAPLAHGPTAGRSSPSGGAVRLERPGALALAPGGTLYIADSGRNQILVRRPDGRLEAVAGNGSRGFAGDGGRASDAELDGPGGIALAPDGTLYVADTGNGRVRAISPRGIIRTVAGGGRPGWVESGAPAAGAGLTSPAAAAIGPDGRLYIADAGGWGEILRLDGRLLTRIAGTRGPEGVFGIGQPATRASADGPAGLAFDRAGNLYIAGLNTKTLLMVARDGTMRLPAGNNGFYPRGPGALVTAPDGRVLAANTTSIVRLTPHGIRPIRRVGRTFAPEGIAVGPNGSLYVDTWVGNGFADRTALLEITARGRVRVLWQA